MAQQGKQALPNMHAIAAAVPAASDGALTLTVAAADSAAVAEPPAEHAAEAFNGLHSEFSQQRPCSDIGQAIDLLNNTARAVARLHRAARHRQRLDLQPAKQAVDALIENQTGDLNPLFWALAANRRMYHLNRRAVGCAVWALALGRRLQLDRSALQELLLGALLLDIGKLDVPVVILAKTGKLNKLEQNFTRRHVTAGLRMLASVDGLSQASFEMVSSHHERIDGSGYPFGLRGDEIPLFAQIAGIADSFDAMSLKRYYADALSAHAAVSMLREQAGDKFDPILLEHFCAAIGEFPTGTWVEFADGRTGVVCSQETDQQRDPQVVLIADEQQQPILSIQWLSLHAESAVRALPPAERPPHATAMERSLQAAIYARSPLKPR